MSDKTTLRVCCVWQQYGNRLFQHNDHSSSLVKIHRRKSVCNRVKRPKGGALIQVSLNRQIPTEGDCISHSSDISLYHIQQKQKIFSPCLTIAQPMRDCHNSVNENCHTSNTVSSSGCFVYSSPAQLSLLFCENLSLLLYQTVVSHSCIFQIAICCSWVNQFCW